MEEEGVESDLVVCLEGELVAVLLVVEAALIRVVAEQMPIDYFVPNQMVEEGSLLAVHPKVAAGRSLFLVVVAFRVDLEVILVVLVVIQEGQAAAPGDLVACQVGPVEYQVGQVAYQGVLVEALTM